MKGSPVVADVVAAASTSGVKYMRGGAYNSVKRGADSRAIIARVIWEPFVLALVLGLLVSAGLYFAYLWPAVEPLDDDDVPPTRQNKRASTEPPKSEATS